MIILKKKDELRMNLTKIDEGATWPELVEEFVNFIQGCGYIVTGLEIGEYLVSEYKFQKEKNEEIKLKRKRK
jgi:hypothetical protein